MLIIINQYYYVINRMLCIPLSQQQQPKKTNHQPPSVCEFIYSSTTINYLFSIWFSLSLFWFCSINSIKSNVDWKFHVSDIETKKKINQTKILCIYTNKSQIETEILTIKSQKWAESFVFLYNIIREHGRKERMKKIQIKTRKKIIWMMILC